MDKEHIILLAGVTACAIGLSVFVFWGPKTTSYVRRGPLVGLQNLGFTCFLNSLLQALASCAFFVEWLEMCEGQGRVSDALLKVLKILSRDRSKQDNIEEPYSPIEVITTLKQHGFAMEPVEQDAHELFYLILITLEEEAHMTVAPSLNGCLLDALNPDEINKNEYQVSSSTLEKHLNQGDIDVAQTSTDNGYLPNNILSVDSEKGDLSSVKRKLHPLDCNRNPMPSPFRGFLTSQLLCTVCGFKSVLRYDKLDSISLHLPESSNRHTLVQLLDNFFKAEPVAGVVCDGCNRQQEPDKPPITTTSIKTLSIGKLPRCLCLHIPRTSVGPYGTPFKRQDIVDFTEFITMDSYTRNNRLKQQRVTVDTNSDLLPVSNGLESCLHLYRLKAVIVHRGCVERGHFVTYRRGPLHSNTRHRCSLSNRWYITSDAEVRDATLCDALQSTPYMLFYEKCTEVPA